MYPTQRHGGEVLESQPTLSEEVAQGDITHRLQLGNHLRPLRWDRILQALQNLGLRVSVEMNLTAGGKQRKALANLLFELTSSAPNECPESVFISKLFAMVSDEVKNCTYSLVPSFAQPSTELLHE
jgi:hypothetical protein